jgi:hypothetical protein
MSWSALNLEQRRRRLRSLSLELTSPECSIICLTCGYALSPRANGVSRHLWEKHQIPKCTRNGLSRFLRSLCLLDPNSLPRASDHSSPYPGLRIQYGKVCRHCPYRTLSRDLIFRHLSTEHNAIKADRMRTQACFQDDVPLQSWTLSPSQGYWIVSLSKEHRTSLPVEVSQVIFRFSLIFLVVVTPSLPAISWFRTHS